MALGEKHWTALATLALAMACDEPAELQVRPDVSVVDGVEVASLAALPPAFDPRHAFTFRVVREVRTVVGPENEPLVFDPRRLLPLADGTLLLHDPAPEPLVIMDPAEGVVLRRFGRNGQGPGELGSGYLLLSEADEGGGVVILDSANRQIHRYSSMGDWQSSQAVTTDAWGGLAQPDVGGSGYLLELLRQTEAEWWRELAWVDANTGASRFFARLPDPSPGAELGGLQRGRALWTVLADGAVGMWSDRPVLNVYDDGGSVVRRLELPLTRRTLTDQDIEDHIARYGGIARSLRPGPAAMTNMLYTVNDTVFGMFFSSLWRAAEDPPVPAGEIYWRLFTIRGEYLGVVRQPEDFRYLGRGDGTMWIRILDELGNPVLQEVVLAPRDGS